MYKVERATEALVPLLAPQIVLSMEGGSEGVRQVPEHRRQARMKRLLVARAGNDGSRVDALRKLLWQARAYAAMQVGLPVAE